MPQEEKNINHYNAQDIERYHSGRMTEQEMHALEKAALDDPFLADALEGYRHTQSPVADIDEIKSRLSGRTGRGKVVWYKTKPVSAFLKVAAVLILFTGFGLFLYRNNNAPVKTEVASANDNLAERAELNKVAQGTDRNKNAVAVSPPLSKTTTGNVQQIIQQTNRDRQDSSLNTKSLSINADASIIPTEKVTVKVNDSASLASVIQTNYYSASTENNLDNRSTFKMLPGFQANQSRTLKGKVTDSKGSPVTFANVVDTKNKQAIPVDKEGSFSFTTSDSTAVVNINATGYKTVNKELNDDSRQNNFMLMKAPDAGINEIVTNAYATKRKRDDKFASEMYRDFEKDKKAPRVRVTNAIPVQGWQEFNNYITDSLKTVEQLGPNASSVEVLVSFDVNNIGEPIDIHVKQSLCIPCDAEALRIIKNGPHWMLNKKKKKANAVVRF